MNIQYPFLWKNLRLALCCVACALSPVPGAFAQCAGNLGSRSYDTVVSGPGYGVYNLSFPRWSPDSGLLVSVKINANVSVQYGFTMKNADVSASVYTLWVGREDQFTSPALNHVFDSTKEVLIGNYSLAPGESVTENSWPFMDRFNYSDSIVSNIVPFQGVGRVSFVYSPITYTTLHTNNNSSYNYHATASDLVHFSITYLYCRSGGVLASDLFRFTAVPVAPACVKLDWAVGSEVSGRVYEVQRSRDGLAFTTVGSLSSDAGGGLVSGMVDYGFTDRLTGPGRVGPDLDRGIGGKWYYRLRITGPGGVFYSPVRQVILGQDGDGRLIVYPNPAVDYIDLMPGVMDGGGGGGRPWVVDVIAADGCRVLRQTFNSSHAMRVYFRRSLAAGVYFVRVTDGLSLASYFSSFVVGRR